MKHIKAIEGKKKTKYTSPRGPVKWPWVTRPDTKYNKDGQFKVDLILEGDAADEMIALIDEAAEARYAEAQKSVKPQKKKDMSTQVPYEPEFDDEGEETGRTVFKFRQNATIKFKNDDGTEDVQKVKIAVFNGKGKPVGSVKLGGGSECKVGFTMRPYYNAKDNAVGVRLDFGAVFIMKLVEFSGSADSASAWGYEADEDDDVWDGAGAEDDTGDEDVGGEEDDGEEDF